MRSSSQPLAQEFVAFAVEAGVLRFGEFKTKAGRLSPYFFNAGLFDDGAKLGRLAGFYAESLIASGLAFDMIFGPAYKGITLAAAVAIELARRGHNKPLLPTTAREPRITVKAAPRRCAGQGPGAHH